MTMPDIQADQNTYDKLVQIPSVYFNKTNFKIYLETISKEIDELNQARYDLRFQRSVDTATGIHLDNLGEIVGEPRTYDPNLDAGYFTYGETAFSDTGFDEGKFWSLGTIAEPITREDSVYRKAIQAKILKNNGYATPEEIITLVKTLTGATQVIFENEFPAGCSIYFDVELESAQISYIYNFIQSSLPATVNLNNFGTYYELLDNDGNELIDNDDYELISN